MQHLLFGPGSVPFAAALGIVLGIGLIEVAMLLLGGSLLGLDAESPHIDVAGADPSDLGSTEVGSGDFSFKEWLQIGELPGLMLLVLGLSGFGLTGLLIQVFANGNLNPWLVSIPATLGGGVALRFIGGPIQRVLKRSDGKVTALDELVGSEATIVLGRTSAGFPTQAKLKDLRGQTHYVMVEPLRPQDAFETGETVLLAQRNGPKFLVVGNSDHLFDDTSLDSPDHIRGRV